MCDAPTSAGSYTLATDALAALPSTAKMIAMFARASATATATAGDWPITFTALSAVDQDSDSSVWQVPLTLQ